MHYKQLPQLHAKYKERGFNILAFPCNQFLSQEPGSNEEIAQFAADRGVEFPLFAKVKVNGLSGVEPVYAFLKAKAPGSYTNTIKWNFTKFLCDHEGVPLKRYSPKTEPLSLCDDIEAALGKKDAAEAVVEANSRVDDQEVEEDHPADEQVKDVAR